MYRYRYIYTYVYACMQVSRMEAIAVRDEALKLSSKASSYKRPLDAVT